MKREALLWLWLRTWPGMEEPIVAPADMEEMEAEVAELEVLLKGNAKEEGGRLLPLLALLVLLLNVLLSGWVGLFTWGLVKDIPSKEEEELSFSAE